MTPGQIFVALLVVLWILGSLYPKLPPREDRCIFKAAVEKRRSFKRWLNSK